MAITLKQKEKFIDLRSDGISFNSISEKMKISKNTLIKLQLELEDEIKNATYLKYQSIIEKYKLNKINKIESHSKLLEKIILEVEKRNLSELTIKELILLKTKVENDLSNDSAISYITDETIPDKFNELFTVAKKTLPL